MSQPPPIDPLARTGATSATVDERIGKLFGEYRITARVGAGGMGAVYAAEHVRLGRIAAVKILHGDLARDGKAIQRFATEALTVAKLQHANVVDLYDVGETPEPHCVMELLRGRSLAALLAGGALAEARILYIAAQVLGVLELVHARGITHRDIKPDNIFLVEDDVRADHVKLLDFGIAKIRDGQAGAPSATTGGAMIGTPLYMAPEQIEGGTVDARTDLYAFGLVLHEMVTGKPPFSATTLTALLSKQLLEVPPAPRTLRPEISPALDGAIVRCIAKKPDDRFASAGEVLRALGIESARSVAARWPASPAPATGNAPIGLTSTLGRASGEIAREARAQAKRKRALPAIGVLLGAFAVAVGIFFAFRAPRHDDAAPNPNVAPPSPAPLPIATPAPSADLLARAAVLLSVGDQRGALHQAHAAVAAGAGRDGWMLVARAACGAHQQKDLDDALAHLTAADAAVATHECGWAPRPHPTAPRHGPKPIDQEGANGAPIVE